MVPMYREFIRKGTHSKMKANGHKLLIFMICAWLLPPLDAGASLPAGDNVLFTYGNGVVSVRGDRVDVVETLERLALAAGIEIHVFDPIPDRPFVSMRLNRKPTPEAISFLLKGFNYAVVYHGSPTGKGLHIAQGKERGKEKSPAEEGIAGDDALRQQGPSQGPVEIASQRRRRASAQDGAQKGNSGLSPLRDHHPSEEMAGGGEDPQGNPAEAAGYPAGGTGGGYPSAGQGPSESEEVVSESPALSPAPANAAGTGRDPIRRLQALIARHEQRISDGSADREYDMLVGIVGEGHVIHDRDMMRFFEESLERHQKGQ